MYQLTLSKDERAEIDWIGSRYSNGNDLYIYLWLASENSPDDVDWDSDVDITFTVPEHIAWGISEIYKDNEESWPCFSQELCLKMNKFLDRIV